MVSPLLNLEDFEFPRKKANLLGYYARTIKTLNKITLKSLIKSRKSLSECSALRKRVLSKSRISKIDELNISITVSKMMLEKAREKLVPLEADSKVLKKDLIPKSGFINNLFKETELRPSSKIKLSEIEEPLLELKNLVLKLNKEIILFSNEIRSIEAFQKVIMRTVHIVDLRIEKLSAEEAIKKQKIDQEKQKKAAELNRIRETKNKKLKTLRVKLASSKEAKRKLLGEVKKTVRKNTRCPYCYIKFDLIIETHLDHIYPMSRGGQEEESNLVFTCADCNVKKSNLTLREFISKFKLNRGKIESELEKLGKSF